MAEPPWSSLLDGASNDEVQLARIELCPGITLRARGDACARVAVALGVPALPAANRTTRGTGGALACWLRPDEWVLLGDGADPAGLSEAVGADGAVIDTTASRVGFVLSGARARDVLASCCPLDTRPVSFGPGQCAQTLIGHAGVLLAVLEGDRYLVVCRPSTADYVVRWLVEGMRG